MAKRGYKQGAMSATDAITQLRAAAAKCDNKWMKAHAASARFFGAREADVKKALSKCGTIKSSLMGVKREGRRQRGIRGTEAQHMRSGLDFVAAADRALTRASTAGTDRERHAGALEAFRLATHAHAECSWEPTGYGPDCVQSADALAKRAKKLLGERIDGPARGVGRVRGLKGTAKQHADRASRHLRAAREELEWMTEGPKNLVGDRKTRKALETKIRRHLAQGGAECSWTKGKVRAACEAEIRSIDTALSRRKRSRKR